MAPIVTTSSVSPSDQHVTQVRFEGATYECESAGAARWECGRPGSSVYCDGAVEPNECSSVWYPAQLQGIRLVTFEGIDYACESYGLACVSYRGDGPPPALWNPDVWCDGLVCTHYDPEVWFEVTFDFSTYFCTDGWAGFEQYDCYHSFSGSPPQVTLDPDLYCSGSEYALSCDERWYPDELSSFEIVSFGGSDYICEPSYVGSFGDYDCGTYRGGDPSFVYTGELNCTNRGTALDCAYDYYPSEFDGVSVVNIGGADYLCENSWGGSECYRYFGGSPASAMFGIPDLYCNFQGLCDERDYP